MTPTVGASPLLKKLEKNLKEFEILVRRPEPATPT
jgi:hypothetical protein